MSKIVIRAETDTYEEFQRFSAVYDDHEDALKALLDAHKDHAEKTRRPAW
jgi:hypothetical protein